MHFLSSERISKFSKISMWTEDFPGLYTKMTCVLQHYKVLISIFLPVPKGCGYSTVSTALSPESKQYRSYSPYYSRLSILNILKLIFKVKLLHYFALSLAGLSNRSRVSSLHPAVP